MAGWSTGSSRNGSPPVDPAYPMAGIPQEIIDEVRRRADIAEVIGGYMALKKAGANYKGLCPFHREKTPSFNVNPSMQIFRCFGCGEGGNVFNFLMKYENLTFPQAVETMARRYGVDIPKNPDDRKKQDKLERLYDAVAEAADFFHRRLLREPDGSPIKKYLAQRGLTPEQVAAFRLGWAPDDWEDLYKALVAKKFSAANLEEAGLIKKAKSGNYIDRFRGRLMFPITSAGGRVIAFGGRIIVADEKAPKYLNSPETPIYHKSSVLYGYHEGIRAAREAETFIVVEGYMDTLALHAAGLHNVCAVSGTALTEEHGEMIRRVCDRAVLLFDADRAGEEAVKKSGPALLAIGLSVGVVSLTDAKDPDEYLKSHGPEALRKVVADAPAFLRYVIDRILSVYDLADLDQRIRAVRRALPYLQQAPDRIERAGYVEYLAEKTELSSKAITEELAAKRTGPGGGVPGFGVGPGGPGGDADRRPAPPPPKKDRLSGAQKAERMALGVLLVHPEYLAAAAADLVEEDFSTEAARAAFRLIRRAYDRGVKEPADALGLADNDLERKEFAALSAERHLFDEEGAEGMVVDCLRKIRYRPEEKRRAKAELVAAEESGDSDRLVEAQKKYMDVLRRKL